MKEKIETSDVFESKKNERNIISNDKEIINENKDGLNIEKKEKIENREKEDNERIKELTEKIRMRDVHESKSIVLTIQEEQLVSMMADKTKKSLEGNYQKGFGISPCSDPNENFYDQMWARDGAHSVGNYYGKANPEAVKESLETLFKYQKEDGQLPLKVERVEAMLRLVPGIGVWLSKAVFKLRVKEKDGIRERGIYKGQDLTGGEDTVPSTIVAAGEFFLSSEDGKKFFDEHYDQIKKAIEHFKTKVDKEDGLAVTGKSADWAETIRREGKLSTINVTWARALRMMEFTSRQMGKEEDANKFKEDFTKVKESILEKLYDKEGNYFRTSEGENQVDTVGSVFGALYLLSPVEAAKVEETLSKRVKHSSGLVNFDPPYSEDKIFWVPRVSGMSGYHNKFVWPWVTCENIQVKIKIALGHPDEKIREQYKKEAIEDLVSQAKLFEQAGGAREIVNADSPDAPKGIYTPPKNLMGSLAAYQGAYQQLKKLDWI